jgi:hypothetical protein
LPAEDQITQLEPRLIAAGLKPAEALPLIAPLLNLPLPTEYPPSPLPPAQQRRCLLATLVEWVLGTARAQPLIIATEDLHWADPSTLELIQLLVEQGAHARLLLFYIGPIQGGLLRIHNLPKQHRIHIHRYSVFGQSFFCFERTGKNAGIYPVGNGVNKQNNHEQPGTLQRVKFAEPQDDRLAPLIRDLNCGRDHERQHKGSTQNPRACEATGNPIHAVCECSADACDYDEY